VRQPRRGEPVRHHDAHELRLDEIAELDRAYGSADITDAQVLDRVGMQRVRPDRDVGDFVGEKTQDLAADIEVAQDEVIGVALHEILHAPDAANDRNCYYLQVKIVFLQNGIGIVTIFQALLRGNASRPRQFLLPVVRPLARLSIVLVLPWRSPRAFERDDCRRNGSGACRQ
jgi:hypothetical protein